MEDNQNKNEEKEQPKEKEKDMLSEKKTEEDVQKQNNGKIKKEISQPKKKDKAKVNAVSLRISTKQSKYVLKMIKGKKIDDAIKMLEKVITFKRAVPMNGLEIPHRKGMTSGRYPINTTKEILKLLKQLKANSNICGIENPYIFLAMANIASRPYRKGRTRGKRTHIYLEARKSPGGEK